MMCVYFEKHWEQPVVEMRKELNIEDPPHTPQKAKVPS
jgi:ubiquinone biosynthesis protein Coq4